MSEMIPLRWFRIFPAELSTREILPKEIIDLLLRRRASIYMEGKTGGTSSDADLPVFPLIALSNTDPLIQTG